VARPDTTTGAEAHILHDRSRGAEAPLFHGAARIVNFPQAIEVVPVAISILKPQLAPQLADDGGDVVFLEEADGGDSGGTSFEAESGILNVYSAQG